MKELKPEQVKLARDIVSQVCGTFALEGVAFDVGFKAEMMRKTVLDLTRRHGMGWASGSEIMSEIIDETKSAIRDKKKRKAYYKHLIHVFQMHDSDTLDDCRDDDPLFAEALDEMQ
jgi:hypothetical protein